MNRDRTRFITRTAMGIALFVAASLALRVPFFDTYYLCLGYIVMGVYVYFFGLWSGVMVGGIGTFAYCLLISSMSGVVGWTAGNIVIAVLSYFLFEAVKKMEKPLLKYGLMVIGCVAFTAVGVILVKSVTETALYQVPILLRLAKNSIAFVGDSISYALSVPVIAALDKQIHIR